MTSVVLFLFTLAISEVQQILLWCAVEQRPSTHLCTKDEILVPGDDSDEEAEGGSDSDDELGDVSEVSAEVSADEGLEKVLSAQDEVPVSRPPKGRRDSGRLEAVEPAPELGQRKRRPPASFDDMVESSTLWEDHLEGAVL